MERCCWITTGNAGVGAHKTALSALSATQKVKPYRAICGASVRRVERAGQLPSMKMDPLPCEEGRASRMLVSQFS